MVSRLWRPCVAVLFCFITGCGGSQSTSEGTGGSPRTAGSLAVSPNGISAGLPPVGTPVYNLDKIGDVTSPYTKQPVIVSAAGDLTASGFAIDQKNKNVAGGVDVAIDGLPFIAHYGIDRPDVATFFKDPVYAKTGYSFAMAARLLGAGKHQLAVRVIANDKKSYAEGPMLSFEIQ